ncbi:MAG: dockerin type I domain-containing protein [Phycisphaerae bacterium]
MSTVRVSVPRFFCLTILVGFVPLVLGVSCPGPGETVQAVSDVSPPAEAVPADVGPSGPSDQSGESGVAPIRGDLNGDGIINEADFDVMSAAWLSKVGEARFNPAADLDGDGVIGLSDFQILESLATGANG